MTPHLTVATLNAQAIGAAWHHGSRRAYRTEKAANWDRLAATYARAVGIYPGCYSQAPVWDARMQARTLYAQHRAEAWRAISRGDAEAAAHHRRQALRWRAAFLPRCGRARA
jgi:hypothetical protein